MVSVLRCLYLLCSLMSGTWITPSTTCFRWWGMPTALCRMMRGAVLSCARAPKRSVLAACTICRCWGSEPIAYSFDVFSYFLTFFFCQLLFIFYIAFVMSLSAIWKFLTFCFCCCFVDSMCWDLHPLAGSILFLCTARPCSHYKNNQWCQWEQACTPTIPGPDPAHHFWISCVCCPRAICIDLSLALYYFL